MTKLIDTEAVVEEFVKLNARYRLENKNGKNEIVLVSSATKENTDWLTQTLEAANQKHEEVVREKLGEVVNRKFPRGEREWCIQCAKRIRKAMTTSNK